MSAFDFILAIISPLLAPNSEKKGTVEVIARLSKSIIVKDEY